MNQRNTNVKQERRKYIRIKSDEILQCHEFDAEDLISQNIKRGVTAITKNLSAGGVLFESKVSYEIGSLLKLEIKIPGWNKFKSEFFKEDEKSHGDPLVVLVSVIRLEVVEPGKKYDIGVCFSAIDEGHRWALIKYIKQKTK